VPDARFSRLWTLGARAGSKGNQAMQATETDEELLTVGEVAKRLRVKCSWVYRHANALGAYHLKKYIRFSWPRVLERIKTGIE
jgi:hypothetical protein